MATLMESWNGLSGGRRASLVVMVGLIAAATVAAFFWLTAKDYAVLFADMEPRDAAKVVAELERQKIRYRLAASGTQIMIPDTEVHEVRLKMMGGDVPLTGGVGFELFDDSDFGMTDFAQRINYQRALEGELTRTIMSLKEVKYARVHLVMPDKGLFRQEDSAPTASVTLFFKPGFNQIGLGDTQVAGIQRLVSAAVPRLEAAQVTVSDQAGMTLSRQLPAQAGLAAVSGRLQQKQAVEQYLAGKVSDVLERTFGAHQVMVSVDVTLNFNEVKRTRENVVSPEDDGGSVLRRRETRMGQGADAGAASNITTEVEYQLGRTIEQIVESPGEIMRLSVGVMVPSDTTEQRRTEIRELVEMVVGVNRDRGDAVAVYTLAAAGDAPAPQELAVQVDDPFPVAPQEIAPVSPSTHWLQRLPVLTIALAAAATLLLLASLSLLSRGRRSAPVGMSAAERDEALRKLRAWLDQPTDPGEPV